MLSPNLHSPTFKIVDFTYKNPPRTSLNKSYIDTSAFPLENTIPLTETDVPSIAIPFLLYNAIRFSTIPPDTVIVEEYELMYIPLAEWPNIF